MKVLPTILALGCLGLAARAEEGAAPGDLDFFERRVRPVLAEHCLGCHGPEKPKGGIRLDSRAAILRDHGSGPLVAPGEPEESLIIGAVRREGPLPMPPKAALEPGAVADLAAWIKMGAPWPEPRAPAAGAKASDHWAFRPVVAPPTPEVRQGDWARTSVDPFVLAGLEAKGLTPSTPADKRTLIRRATFDLTGLPPTFAEVAAFVDDDSPDAFDRVVDRLLASPSYGERWGRLWLDVARYADTKGYILFEDASYPWAYTYRDYVVEAFNADLPYDRFIVEQLAADLPGSGADRRALRALGFLTLGNRFMNNLHDVIDDRIDVVSRGLLGLTVACARCHDHKFDPIPTEDYYSLYGVFANAVEPTTPPLFGDPPSTPEYAKFAEELKVREARLAEFVAAKHRKLVDGSKARAADYLLAAQAALGQPSTEMFMLLADGGDLNPAMIIRWQGLLERTRKRPHPVLAPWHALASLPSTEFAARAKRYADDPPPGLNPLVARALAEAPPGSPADLARIYARVLNQVEAARASGGELDPPSAELAAIYRGPDAPPDLPFDPYGDLALLPDRPAQAELGKLRTALVTWRSTGPGAPARAMALEDLPTPVEPRVFNRGNAHNPGRVVPRRFLEVVTRGDRQPFGPGSGRLELARAIANRANPLTARVLVNRVWMHHFDAPLVRTPGDFGLRSEPPTHPQLLDHLAAAFMDGGWSIKALHRTIMLSNAYRQTSGDRVACRAVDPENTLIWRMNPRRLDFESTRDALLAASGKLDPAIGGAPSPDLVGDAANRRTLYGLIDRLNLPGLYRTFDFPDPNASSPRRDPTTVAPQALFLMNHPFAIRAAAAIAARPEVAGEAELGRKVVRIYERVFQRPPLEDERAFAEEFIRGEGAEPGAWNRYVQALLISNEFVSVD